MDTRTPAQRSKIMSSIGSTNTKPEMCVRRLLHRMGYRYRIHAKDLSGRPDIVFRSKKRVIFVNGCFWHFHHKCKSKKRLPASRISFWKSKLTRNRARDQKNHSDLRKNGWKVLVIWECDLKNDERLCRILTTFMKDEVIGISEESFNDFRAAKMKTA